MVALAAGGLAAAGYFMTQPDGARVVRAQSGVAPPTSGESTPKKLQRRPSWEAKFEAPSSSSGDDMKTMIRRMSQAPKDGTVPRPNPITGAIVTEEGGLDGGLWLVAD